MIGLEALSRTLERQGRPCGAWRNRFWLPSALPFPPSDGMWGPGETLGIYAWPSRDVAETKAADWLAYYERLGWVERFGRPIYRGAVFLPGVRVHALCWHYRRALAPICSP